MATPAAWKRFERAVAGYLRSAGLDATRAASTGHKDHGDIHGIPGWVLQLECRATTDLARVMDKTRDQAARAGVRWYAAVLNRRQASVAHSYVIMDLRTLTELICETSTSSQVGSSAAKGKGTSPPSSPATSPGLPAPTAVQHLSSSALAALTQVTPPTTATDDPGV